MTGTDEPPQNPGAAAESRDVRRTDQPFDPKAVPNVIEEVVGRVTDPRVGAAVAMAYSHLTDLLFLGLWAGSVYLFTYSLQFASYARNLALINITIGTFVLMAGANLIDRFEGQAVNMRAYIHNAITFIASGLAFLLGFLSRRIVENYTFEQPFAMVAEGWLLVLNVLASFLFLVSVWVLLKLLWRLDRLLTREDGFHKSQEVYGEFRESIEGISADPGRSVESGDGMGTATGLLVTAVGILVLGGVPYLLTGTWVWPVIVLGAGYVAYAAVEVRRGTFGPTQG